LHCDSLGQTGSRHAASNLWSPILQSFINFRGNLNPSRRFKDHWVRRQIIDLGQGRQDGGWNSEMDSQARLVARWEINHSDIEDGLPSDSYE